MSVSAISNNSSNSSTGQLVGSNSSMSQSDFYKIITSELQNQDPENATDPNQLLTDIESLSTYQATQTEASDVSSLQSYSLATSLLGKQVGVSIPATSDTDASTDSGTVTNVGFSGGTASVTVDGTAYPVTDITSAQNASTSTN